MKEKLSSCFTVFAVLLLSFTLVSSAFGQERGSTILIERGTLIDGTKSNPRPNPGLLIKEDQIVRIGSVEPTELPSDTERIDATGKFIVPAFIDAHMHHKDWDGELFIAHGVTTAVSLGDYTEWMMAQKEGVAKGKIRGPRLFASGSMINGPFPSESTFQRQYFAVVHDSKEARAVVRNLISQGADVIKVYEDLNEEMLRSIIDEAHQAGKPVVGHTPSAWQAVKVGYDGIVHTLGIAEALSGDAQEPRDQAQKGSMGGSPYKDPHSRMDLSQANKLIQAMVDTNVALNPTLRAQWNWKHREKFQHEDFHLLFNNPKLRYVPLDYRLAILKEYNQHPWTTGYYFFEDLSAEEKRVATQSYDKIVTFLKMFVEAGGKVFLGSDTISTPGLSLHQELQLLVDDVGLSPAEALATVTRNAAEVLRVEGELGTLEEGKLADIVILRDNPLEDIRNTRTIDLVMKAGKVLDISYHPDYTNPIPRSIAEDTAHIFPSPVIKEISPVIVVEGTQPFTLTVRGTGFIPYSTVQFNGIRLPTEFRSPFELAARIRAELVHAAGTYPVVVINPHPVGTVYAEGASEFVYFGERGDTSPAAFFMVKFR